MYLCFLAELLAPSNSKNTAGKVCQGPSPVGHEKLQLMIVALNKVMNQETRSGNPVQCFSEKAFSSAPLHVIREALERGEDQPVRNRGWSASNWF